MRRRQTVARVASEAATSVASSLPPVAAPCAAEKADAKSFVVAHPSATAADDRLVVVAGIRKKLFLKKNQIKFQ